MLPDVLKQHPDWEDQQLYNLLMAEMFKPQEDNLVWQCVNFCVAEALDHKAEEDYHQAKGAGQ